MRSALRIPLEAVRDEDALAYVRAHLAHRLDLVVAIVLGLEDLPEQRRLVEEEPRAADEAPADAVAVLVRPARQHLVDRPRREPEGVERGIGRRTGKVVVPDHVIPPWWASRVSV